MPQNNSQPEFPLHVEVDGFPTPMAQGLVKEITEESDPYEMARDELGFTTPNLHRRTFRFENEEDNIWPPGEPDALTGIAPEEYKPREYTLSTQGLNSYLSIETTYHEEDDPTQEMLDAYANGEITYQQLIQSEVP